MGSLVQTHEQQTSSSTPLPAMDAIRKKFEDETKESNSILEQAECDIRDYGKKVHGFEIDFDETLDKLNKANKSYEEKDKMHKEVEADIAALSRRIMLMEEESKKAEVNLATTVTKMASDNEQKLDELSRKLGVQEEELKRAIERAELAESKLNSIEEELQMVGENMKQLELSAEKAVEREEKLKEKILSIQNKYKMAEGRFEYGEMNITKLNQRIDDIEDEIYREKLKIKKVADELGDT